jgi:16S rRNA C967 or C1407 C5-methylase (RsmB/RsmF family)/NOL1/NOP2/fmu family ribosome biogenesis protein
LIPESLINSLCRIAGFDKTAFLEVHASGKQITSIRLNPIKTALANDFPLQSNIAETVPWCEHGKYLIERPSFTLDPMLHGGAYYVQEASSMFLWYLLDQTIDKTKKELKILDLCAAPGGKTTLLASYFPQGLVIANEVIRSRAGILSENITRWGTENVVITSNDPSSFAKLENYFDVIVVDAPCSGSGLFRKDPTAVDEWSEANVLMCSQRQKRILENIYPALKKGGLLIYSTCSYSREEDEDIVAWMKKFPVDGCRLPVPPEWNILETLIAQDSYGYRFFPNKIKGEGFFIAAFRKKEGDDFSDHISALTSASKKEIAAVSNWIKEDVDLFYFKQGENIIAIPARWKQEITVLQKNLYLRKAGITIGIMKGQDFIPNHEFALSLLQKEDVPHFDVNLADAVQYLKRKELTLKNLPKGWAVLSYCGINIGWVKVLENRINNYYPVEWRILKH